MEAFLAKIMIENIIHLKVLLLFKIRILQSKIKKKKKILIFFFYIAD